MTEPDDTELDEILADYTEKIFDSFLEANAIPAEDARFPKLIPGVLNQAIIAWSQHREAAARIDELERINKLAQSAHSEGRGIKEIEDRIAKLTSDRTGGGKETK